MSIQFGPPPQAQQQYPAPPLPYDAPRPPYKPPLDDRTSSAIAGFWLGLVGLLTSLLPVLGLPVVIAGLVFSIRGTASHRSTYAIVGVILTGFGLLLNLAVTGDFCYMLLTGQLD